MKPNPQKAILLLTSLDNLEKELREIKGEVKWLYKQEKKLTEKNINDKI